MEPKYTLDIKKNIVAAIIKERKANPDATPTSVIKSHAKTHNIPFNISKRTLNRLIRLVNKRAKAG